MRFQREVLLATVFLALFMIGVPIVLSYGGGRSAASEDPKVYLPVVLKRYLTPRILSSNWVDVVDWTETHCTLVVVGEVLNDSSQPIEYVRIEGTSSAGIPASTYADMDTLGPGMKSAFQIQFRIEQTGFVACDGDHWQDLHVESCNIASLGPYELQVTSQNDYYTDGNTVYHVAGTITNQLGETHTSIKALVTVYNSGGEAVGHGWSYTSPSDLDPGQNATFHVAIDDWLDCPGGNHGIASYQLRVVDD